MQKNTTDIKPHMGRITSVMRIAAKNVCKVWNAVEHREKLPIECNKLQMS